MVSPSTGSVVLVHFPFSDLSATKLRPAVVLARVGSQDWILCQITSNAYSDPVAIEIGDEDFDMGSLRRLSYVRVGKLFTTHLSLISSEAGKLKQESFERIIIEIVKIFRTSIENK